MNAGDGQAFRRLPLRVAAITTATVAVLYTIAALAVLGISGNKLVANIDGRLGRQLAAIQARPDVVDEISAADVIDLDNDGDARHFDAPLVVWVRGPGGDVYQSDATAVLPADLGTETGPTTATIRGAQMRLVGGPLVTATGTGWVTIAQALGEVASATNTLVVAEVLTAPALLLMVFTGALLVGRRVAGPIERVRVAQLSFTADASHELRTPLAVIEAETSLALESARDPAAYRQTLERVQDESFRLRRLVDDLLWLARFDSAPSVPPAEPIDLGALATTTVARFRGICDQRGTRLSTTVTGSLSPVITAPAEWMARLLSVLLDNAVRHSPPGASVIVSVGAETGRVQLTVEDNGPGIPADQRSQVFGRFHRAGNTHEGAGLGLAIGDAIVRSTGGHWEVGDAPGGGARMSVWWPRNHGRAFDSPSLEQNGERSEAGETGDVNRLGQRTGVSDQPLGS
jgi:signal transduction histidine kinase